MERIYSGVVDRTGWPSGPWDGEPDKVQWTDAATGLPCVAVRHHMSGNWCGYVGVANDHPAYEKDCADIGVAVHGGGLTFADRCQEGPEAEAICHVPEPGQSDDVWWAGFDCHHAWDLAPGAVARWTKMGMFPALDAGEVYRDLAYVRAECASLAEQLAQS